MPYTPPTPGTANLVLSRPLPEGGLLKLTGPPAPYSAPAHDAVHLTLAEPLPTTADLLIGGGDDAPILPDASATLTGRLVLRGALAGRQAFAATLTGRLLLRGRATAVYDNAVFRGPSARVAPAHTPAQPCHASALVEPWQTARPLPVAQALMFDPARAVPVDHAAAWAQARRQPTAHNPAWGTAQALGRSDRADWSCATPHRLHGAPVWGVQAGAVGQGVDLSSDQGAATHQQHIEVWGSAQPHGRSSAVGFDQGAHAAHDTRRTPWQEGHGVHSWGGPWAPWVAPPVPPLPVRVVLRLCQRLRKPPFYALALVLGLDPCEAATPTGRIIIPAQEVYIVTHATQLLRLSDGAAIDCTALTLSLDSASWCWRLDATVSHRAQALVEPTASGPVQLAAIIDGTVFHFLAESVQRERSFGRTQLRIGGRGLAALLDAPYAAAQTYTNPSESAAQQLAQAALTLNGASLGWSVDWQITDWLVPAQAWSVQGTPMAALASVAQAAGAFLRPHKRAASISVVHPYPTAPWEWASATPDVSLPVDAVLRESISWSEKPAYNRVYVSGQGQGVLGQVTRAGTAGDVLAPMVVDALITHADAARQRAMAVLCDTGRQSTVTLRTPLLPASGVIDPGTLVQYIDGGASQLGKVRATQIEVNGASVTQSLTLQVHHA